MRLPALLDPANTPFVQRPKAQRLNDGRRIVAGPLTSSSSLSVAQVRGATLIRTLSLSKRIDVMDHVASTEGADPDGLNVVHPAVTLVAGFELRSGA